MSTRSGKKIHKSLPRDSDPDNTECKTERKTRSRRLKENCDALNISLPKTKKRDNYVSYPTDDEQQLTNGMNVRPLRKNTLREVNIEVSDFKDVSEVKTVSNNQVGIVRETRRTKRFAELPDDDGNGKPVAESNNVEIMVKESKKKKKENQDKTKKVLQNKIGNPVEMAQEKTRKKKRVKKRSNSMNNETNKIQKSLNNTNTSADSFHSAAGSPINVKNNSVTNGEMKRLNGTLSKSPAKDVLKQLKTTFETVSEKLTASFNNKLTEKISSEGRNSSKSQIYNETFENNTNADGTKVLSLKLNTTFDKDDETTPLDTTFEKDSKPRQRRSLRTHVSDKENKTADLEKHNNTFEKANKNNSLLTSETMNQITDKPIDNKIGELTMNSTFDKYTNKTDSKSPIISSDNSNVSFDKSEVNVSKISITSDDSKISTENILNATPVLIESSMDVSNSTPLPAPKLDNDAGKNKPLMREGTFTKDGPDPIFIEQKSRRSTIEPVRTPTKSRKSLPSPGNTPFHSNTKAPERQKSIMLNVTRSIEKPTTRNSQAESTRSTRVMFCSPADNFTFNTQRKSKIIKSSMKGSSKSFIFEESAAKPAARKRSYTHNDVEQAKPKRTRLADDLRESVERLSLPRTPSAQRQPRARTSSAQAPAKSSEATTPSKNPPTPRAKSETKSRRLPNFAALHQRQFQKMESLDECQERKAKRAKQLLAPSGTLAVLERGSPRVTTEPQSKEPEKKPQPPLIKTDGKRAYTRFGFKLNLDVNPFSIPSKANNTTIIQDTTAPKDSKDVQIQAVKERGTKSSKYGFTQVRKEIAKQVIMREKSSTSLSAKRNLVRNENRTIIKGVRTNRRFELQMKSRNING